MPSDPTPILIAYDGSEDADRAIAAAGELLDGGPAVVLTVWEPLVAVALSRVWSLTSLIPSNVAELDERSEQNAQHVAEAGVALAEQAGFTATGRWIGDTADIAGEIAAVASELDARIIVTGNRGLHGFRAHLLGSVSEQLLHGAHRPLFVVPPPDAKELPEDPSGHARPTSRLALQAQPQSI